MIPISLLKGMIFFPPKTFTFENNPLLKAKILNEITVIPPNSRILGLRK